MTRGLPSASPAPGLASPEEALRTFVAALRVGRLDRASACLVADACLLTPDATAVHGRAPIREILAQLHATGIGIELEMRAAALRAGDTALSAERWTVRSGGAGATGLARSFDSRTVLRRVGREWKVVLLAPWGWR